MLLHHLFSLHRLSPCTQIVYPTVWATTFRDRFLLEEDARKHLYNEDSRGLQQFEHSHSASPSSAPRSPSTPPFDLHCSSRVPASPLSPEELLTPHDHSPVGSELNRPHSHSVPARKSTEAALVSANKRYLKESKIPQLPRTYSVNQGKSSIDEVLEFFSAISSLCQAKGGAAWEKNLLIFKVAAISRVASQFGDQTGFISMSWGEVKKRVLTYVFQQAAIPTMTAYIINIKQRPFEPFESLILCLKEAEEAVSHTHISDLQTQHLFLENLNRKFSSVIHKFAGSKDVCALERDDFIERIKSIEPELCFNCRFYDHSASNCQSTKNVNLPRELSKLKCSKCHRVSHLAFSCIPGSKPFTRRPPSIAPPAPPRNRPRRAPNSQSQPRAR